MGILVVVPQFEIDLDEVVLSQSIRRIHQQLGTSSNMNKLLKSRTQCVHGTSHESGSSESVEAYRPRYAAPESSEEY